MKFKENIKIFGQSCSPKNYRKLTANKSSIILKQFFGTFIIFLILMIVISIPLLITLPSKINSYANNFDEFTIKLNVSSNHPSIISNHPLVVIDLDKENRTDELILFNKRGITKKTKFGFGEKTILWEDLKDVKQNTHNHQGILLTILYLLIPSLLLGLVILFLLESILFISIIWTLGFIISKLFRFKINKSQLLKTAILSWEAPLFIQIILFPYAKFILVPAILFILLFSGSVWMTGQSKFEKK